MAKTKKREIGDVGEGVACRYLERLGYLVLERNYWKPWGEIDIVCQKAGKLHFIEVKSVSREIGQGSGGGFRPEENLHARKLRRLERVIQTYLARQGMGKNDWQIDLACVYLDFAVRRARVELIENIY